MDERSVLEIGTVVPLIGIVVRNDLKVCDVKDNANHENDNVGKQSEMLKWGNKRCAVTIPR